MIDLNPSKANLETIAKILIKALPNRTKAGPERNLPITAKNPFINLPPRESPSKALPKKSVNLVNIDTPSSRRGAIAISPIFSAKSVTETTNLFI